MMRLNNFLSNDWTIGRVSSGNVQNNILLPWMSASRLICREQNAYFLKRKVYFPNRAKCSPARIAGERIEWKSRGAEVAPRVRVKLAKYARHEYVLSLFLECIRKIFHSKTLKCMTLAEREARLRWYLYDGNVSLGTLICQGQWHKDPEMRRYRW